jgi:Rrf2 family protein
MLLSRAAEYAIRAMTFLAMQPAGQLCGARAIAQAERIPIPFLWKILHNLARRRLIRSFKGIRGGYELALPSDKITLHDVILATDGEDASTDCVLGLARCGEESPCPLHDTWKSIRAQMNAMLEQRTLADLAEVARKREWKDIRMNRATSGVAHPVIRKRRKS